ncbi:MAG: hypothetical protein M9894_27305 [Planctomycetes bacterium]|nr:hypothetical protein [Planctomycetota bacterium]
MTAHGLGAEAALVLDAWPARVSGRRAFAKPALGRGLLAMDVVAPPRATLEARRDDAGDGFGAMLLWIDAGASAALARREGYSPACWARLLAAAGPRGLPALLLDLARGTGDDLLAYRRALRAVAGPLDQDAYHYVPHPVVTCAEPALAFVAPDPGQTGDPGRDSAKAACPALRPALLDRLDDEGPRALPGRFDPAAQAAYVERCLRAAAHGLDVGDLLGDGLRLDARTARLPAAERLEEERGALRALVAPLRDPRAYARRFPRAGLAATLTAPRWW